MDFPYGKIVTEVPREFTPPEAWPEFGWIANPPSLCRREEVGMHPRGIRWSLWPLTFEEYMSDTEPDLSESQKGDLSYSRLISWKRIGRVDVPPGWRTVSGSAWRVDGFKILTSEKDYVESWSESAKRNLKVWRREYLNKKYIIEPITFKEFKDAFKQSTINKKVRSDLLNAVARKQEIPIVKQHSVLWGVRNLATGKIVAGNINYYSPTSRSSIREYPFMLPEARSINASTGLVDHWVTESIARKVNTLVATFFWCPGQPEDWKGFSEFKARFGYQYVAYPPILRRWVKGKFL